MSVNLKAIVAALLASTGSEAAQQTEPSKWLVIELPDGARGGTGRIKGEGSWAQESNVPLPLVYLDVARGCGARLPMFSNNWSHRAHIISLSTADNRKVESCFKLKLPTHFNAGLADANPGDLLSFDSKPFRDLETATSSPKKVD